MNATDPDVCKRACRGGNIMHRWTIQIQTVANAVRLTSGHESLEKTT